MKLRSCIEDAADAFGEDALGPVFTDPLVIETDVERSERGEAEYEQRSYEEWLMSYRDWVYEQESE